MFHNKPLTSSFCKWDWQFPVKNVFQKHIFLVINLFEINLFLLFIFVTKQDFLMKEYSYENLQFFLAILDFKKIDPSNQDEVNNWEQNKKWIKFWLILYFLLMRTASNKSHRNIWNIHIITCFRVGQCGQQGT